MSATEGPYKLPEGWRWVRLGEVCEHKTGLWGPEAPNTREGFPVVRSTEIAGYRIDPQSASVRLIPRERANDYALQSGDILVNKSSGSPQLVGWPTIFEDPGDGRVYLFSNFMLRLRLDQNRAIPWFVLYYLHSHGARAVYLNAQDTTSGLRNLRVSDFINQPIPLPPLSEQRRIVARIEELMGRIREARRLREEARQDTERLWQAVLAETFPRPGSELPNGWRWVRLGEVVRTESGNSKLIKGRLSTRPKPGLFPAYSASGQDVWHSPPEHSGTAIILSAVGARCGKCFLARGQWSAIANTHIIWPLEEVVDAEFLWYLINDENFWVKGQSAQPFVKVKATLDKEIPLPPLSGQRRIVAHLEAVQARIQVLKEEQAATQAELKRLEQAILEKAFRGEL